MGSRAWIDPNVLALAEEKGYAIVSIDYRLAPETKLPDIISDIEPIAKGEHGFVGGDRAQIEAGYKSAKEFMVRYLEPK